ncbi:MAG: DUF4404 family protein [Planctomycetota bacterium]
MTSKLIDELRRTLAELTRELNSTETLDAETRALLGDVVEQIGHKLNEQAGKPAAPTQSADLPTVDDLASSASSRAIAERLQEYSLQFASEHPTLTGVLERTIDALGQLGI